MAITGVRQVAQRVDDLDRACAFYERLLGGPPVARFDPPGLAFFRIGATRLLLDRNAPSALVYLEVDDVAAAVDRARSLGIAVVSEPHVVFDDTEGTFGPPGELEDLAFLADTEGNNLGLMGRRTS